MRILYLLFPFFLLLVQGASSMALRSAKQCRQLGGFCMLGICPFGFKFVGFCSTFMHCCKT
ncbi:gallinacin-3-like [Ciconia boyciana]|uniref:gallinacin-3-like n=1 Tax=Ciconia boyciana TaxID=52775 RepID=UPI003BA2A7A0